MDITPVYGGRATVTFDPAKHYYMVTVPELDVWSLYQPSVTTILNQKAKPQLIDWAAEETVSYGRKLIQDIPDDQLTKNLVLGVIEASKGGYKRAKKRTADVGSVVHRYLEAYLTDANGETPDRPSLNSIMAPQLDQDMIDQANNAIDAGLKFFKEHELQVIFAERPVWSPTYGFIGTGDIKAVFDGKRSILDYKTGKHIYAEYWMQTAAYQMAYQEEFGCDIEQRVVVNVGRDGKLRHKVRDNETLQSDFNGFLGLSAAYRWDCENGQYSKPAPKILGPLRLEIKPICPKCLEVATFRDASGTYWCSNAHYWRQ